MIYILVHEKNLFLCNLRKYNDAKYMIIAIIHAKPFTIKYTRGFIILFDFFDFNFLDVVSDISGLVVEVVVTVDMMHN